MDETGEQWRLQPPPELPEYPMEFLSRSWSVSALEVAKAIGPRPPLAQVPVVMEEAAAVSVSGNPFAFASSTTSLLVMEHIMSQSEATPLASGRLSHSSGGPLNGGGSFSDSPPISPSNIDDDKYCRAGSTPKSQAYRGTCKTVGRWFKDKREKRKEDARAQNAQIHAAVSVAGVAAAVAAIAAATAAASGSGNDDRSAKTDMAVAAAATLVAAQCVEAAEAMGAERAHLAAVVGSAVNVRMPGDIITLTAAAATALRGAATLKARTLKEVWNIAAVIPVEKGGMANHNSHCLGKQQKEWDTNGDEADDLVPQEENFLGLCSRELLARGTVLLKRTRKGALHWKIVSVYINRLGQVTLKMKSRHIAGTITKKKKRTLIEVCKEIKPWPCRHLPEGGEQRRYFGLKTAEQRVIEFECQGQREFEMWTQGVSRLLNAVSDRKAPRMNC